MISKDLFLSSIEIFQKYDEWEHKLYELGVNFWEREELANLVSNYLKLLEYCCNDKPLNRYDPTDISYFIYDCEYGKKADEYYITEADGTEVKFKTAEDLWNYLIKIHPEIEDKDYDEDEFYDPPEFKDIDWNNLVSKFNNR